MSYPIFRRVLITWGLSFLLCVGGAVLLLRGLQPETALAQTGQSDAAFSGYLPLMERGVQAFSYAADVADYVTLPDDFPTITVTATASDTAEGYIFLSNHHKFWTRSKPYLLIMDDRGDPVFYRRMNPGQPAHDFKLQPNGLLTYWDAATGKHYALDETYTIVEVLEPQNGLVGDFHEFQILPNGHKIFYVWQTYKRDMSGIVEGGQTNATVLGTIFQEVDTDDNVVFEWEGLDHIPLTDSWASLTGPVVDYIHTNSIEVDFDGHWIMSSRNTNEVTKINRQTGELIWRMGGKANEFTFVDDELAPFTIQHDARRLENGNLLIFDNRLADFSRAVEYAVDEVAKTATLVWEYRAPQGSRGRIMGNAQRLPNGNTLVNLGSASPMITEVRPDGSEVFQLTLEENIFTYRAFRSPWVGRPQTVPKLVVTRDEAFEITLRYSWNGATEVAAYAIYGDLTESPKTLLTVQPKLGFETTTVLRDMGDGSYNFRVMPLDAEGNQLVGDLSLLETVGVELP